MASKRMSISSLLSNDPPTTPARSEPPIQLVPAQPNPQPAEPALKRPRHSAYSQQYHESYNAYPYNTNAKPNSPVPQQYHHQSPQHHIEDQSIRPSSSSSSAHRNSTERPSEPTRAPRAHHMQRIPSSEDASSHPSSRGVEHGHSGWPTASQRPSDLGIRTIEERWREQGTSKSSTMREYVGNIQPRQIHTPHQLSPVQAALPPPQLRREAVQQSHENAPYPAQQVQRHRQQEAPYPAVHERRPPRPNVRPPDAITHIPLPGSTHSPTVHLHSTGHPYASSQQRFIQQEYFPGPSPVRTDFPRPGMRHDGESPSSYPPRIPRPPTQLIAPLSLSNLPRQMPQSPMSSSSLQGPPQAGPNQQSTVYPQQSQAMPAAQHHTRPLSSPHVSSSMTKGHIFTFQARPASPYSCANQVPRHHGNESGGYNLSETEQGPPPYSRVTESETRRLPPPRSSETEPRRPSSSRSMVPPRLPPSRSTESPRPSSSRGMGSPRPILSRPPEFAIPNMEAARSAQPPVEASLTRAFREVEKTRLAAKGSLESREGSSMFVFSSRPVEQSSEHFKEHSASRSSLGSPVVKTVADTQRSHLMFQVTPSVDNNNQKMHSGVDASPLIAAPPLRNAESTESRPPSSDSTPTVQSRDQLLKGEDGVSVPSRVRSVVDVVPKVKSPTPKSDGGPLLPHTVSLPSASTAISSPLQQIQLDPLPQPRPSPEPSFVHMKQSREAEIPVKEIRMENTSSVLDSKDLVMQMTETPDAMASRSASLNVSKVLGLEERSLGHITSAQATSLDETVSKAEPDEHAFEEELLSLVDGDVKANSTSVQPAVFQAEIHVQSQAPSSKTPVSGASTPVKPKVKSRAGAKTPKAKPAARPDSAASSPQPSKPTARSRVKSGGSSRRKTNVARARSQSIKPSEDTPVPEPEPESQIEKLYCICKQPYEEDRVMIACDRCDEWYHPICVGMPEFEVDLVDQFICLHCTKRDSSLRTTYKTRCYRGLHHIETHDNKSPCWKPARGVFSKYCSDSCGIAHMRAKIAKAGHDPAELWPVLKSARKREGVTIEYPSKKRKLENLAESTVRTDGGDKMDVDGENANPTAIVPGQTNSLAHIRRLHQSLDAREVASLKQHLATIVRAREESKCALDRVATRRRLLDLAVERASERFCGWDARLEMGDSEWADWVDTPAGRKALAGEEGDEDEEASSWWCQISEYCQRHADWQRVRDIEMQLEVDSKNASIRQLTDKERDLRRRIEELDPTARAAKATKRRKKQVKIVTQ